jgi:hypothetical protein
VGVVVVAAGVVEAVVAAAVVAEVVLAEAVGAVEVAAAAVEVAAAAVEVAAAAGAEAPAMAEAAVADPGVIFHLPIPAVTETANPVTEIYSVVGKARSISTETIRLCRRPTLRMARMRQAIC